MSEEIRKIIIRKGTSTQFEQLNTDGGGLDEAEFGFTTDENRLFIGVGDGQNKEVATSTHTDDTDNPHNVTLEQLGGEPEFSKNTAFNKDFGTEEGTVAQGNHGHTFASIIQTPTTLEGYGITDADTSTEVDNKLQILKDTILNGADTAFDSMYELELEIKQNSLNIATNEVAIDTNAGNVNSLQLGVASLSETVDANIVDIQANEDAILTKQDTLVAGTNYKTVNGVDLFDMANNNTDGDAYLDRTPIRTFIGSASTDGLRQIITLPLINNYDSIAGNPYTNYLTKGSGGILQSVILYQQGAPNNNTPGQIGHWLWDILNGKIYRCTISQPGSQFYQWRLEETIANYSDYNVGNALNETTIYRFSMNGVTTEWEASLLDAGEGTTGGTGFESNNPSSGKLRYVENVSDVLIYNSGLLDYRQIYIKYIYQDSLTNTKHIQAQIIHPGDILGITSEDLQNVFSFKTPEGNYTTIRQSTFALPEFKINFGTNADENDVQEIFIYRLS